ncbi:sulfurtransferase [Dyella sp.]|uniref:sulfurtransferase n=1 Tax=Dyella sp. TaxID=1869338 RepID=UPI002ED2C846
MTVHTTLISVAELAALAPDQVLIVDCRTDLADRGKSAALYHESHIPGAVLASLEDDLSDLARMAEGLGRHPLPTEDAFSALLSRWGWHPGLQVVAYDGAGGALAASRLWWMLRLVGIREAAVLNGGWQAWIAAGKPVDTAAPLRLPTQVSMRYDASQLLLEHRVDAPGCLLIDARAMPRFRGDIEPLDPVAGHVPGARNRPYVENLDEQGQFKSSDTLRAAFEQVLDGHAPAEVVHMCGSGVTACHNLLAMEHAGLHGARLYAPSWSGWISDRSRPVARGAE